MSKGKLIIYTGCSGVGKGTIMTRLMELDDKIKLSVSCTTRAPRPGEIPDFHYHYIKKDEFEKLIAEDGFLEYAQYCDNYYGTPLAPINSWIEKGCYVFLEIEVQGAMQVMKKRPDALSIFVLPPSLEELEKRLRNRGTEDEETILKRLSCAEDEMSYAKHYQYQVLNDDVERAVKEILDIIRK
ncbi:MAG: guanylate kinase [Ruminococcus sp.]